jgi:cell division septation protein DedD
MLRKVIWFALIFFIGYIWFSQMKSCMGVTTLEKMSQLDNDQVEEEEAVFQADEDAGDDEYIISDENDEEDRLAALGNQEENYKESPKAQTVEEDDDFVEKSPEVKTKSEPISRDAIRETSYTNKSSIGYYVITGSFSDEVNADRMVEELREMGYKDAEKVVFDFSQYYSVVSGKYDTESSARAKSLELKNQNINAYVHKMRSKLFGE